MKLAKIVLTGAAGLLGQALRKPLADMAETLVSSDLVDSIDDLAPNESYAKVDVGDYDAVHALMEGAEMVVHFGAIADEAPFDDILHSNIKGAYNVWEAAYQQGTRRVIYASSIHAVGMYPKQEFIGTDVPHWPDTFYGVAKCFAENIAQLYWDKRQIEAVNIRILTASGTVGNARALGSFLHTDDLIQLVTRSIETPTVGCTVVYGVSANDRAPVDNSAASFLGYRPTYNAEQHADEILADAPAGDPTDQAQMCQGGPFAVIPLGESGVAAIKAMSEAEKNKG